MGTRRIVAGLAWLLGAGTFVICEAVTAAATPGYSYLGDVISDLGAHGPLRSLMNVAFVVHGAALLVGALGVRAARRPVFVAAATINMIGNVALALVHSNSHLSQIHVAGAAAAIVGGNVAVIVGAGVVGMPRWWPAVSIAFGAFGLGCAVALTTGGWGVATGAVERGSVYPIVAWEVLAGALLVVTARAHRAGSGTME
ncbi:DUF998 domain-containing protein [Williamsia sp. CHRR-6]|uniref:DUF998 domain-containing protein n=1 Tax=Williamsia sp. CHRR-6 TaxID=2835871 RepID=UPI001BDA7D50|nr:DUF998 domain-containing protein [Williamsia sp. CHRR-6]MBT0566226.1 DUF998 domain-containing protein [Williamsia sp. CHRR-6]